MTTAEQLTQVFNDNFVAYFRSHVAHVNVVGRNFHSDHELLGGVYEELQGQIDILAELIRSLKEFMPNDLNDIVMTSNIMPDPIEGDSDELLMFVRDDLEQLKGCYEELMAVAEDEGHEEIANYAQERILALAKHIWMFDSTLG
jgi:DNA-binding ferritin-like protein